LGAFGYFFSYVSENSLYIVVRVRVVKLEDMKENVSCLKILYHEEGSKVDQRTMRNLKHDRVVQDILVVSEYESGMLSLYRTVRALGFVGSV
jgi:hypothetical protein